MFTLTENKVTAKVVASFVGFAMATSLAFGAIAPTAQADELSDLLAQITALQNQLAGLQGGSNTTTTTTGNGYIHHPNVDHMFNTNLYLGARGTDVLMLQKSLNDGGYTVAVSGAGSAGNETSYFGPATLQAVKAFQAANNISPVLGYFYPLTRAEMNKKGAVTTPTDPDPEPSDADGDVRASEGDTPDDRLMPEGVVRFAVTALELKAMGDDANIESITVQFDGDADEDEVIDSVILLDEDGNVIGQDENLDSDEEATFDVDLDIDEGETMEIWVAVNAATGASYATNDGLDFTLEVVEVEASGDVSGLPVSGADITIQDNIDLGTIDVDLDHSSASIEIGEEDELLATIEFHAQPEDDESMFVKSFRLENNGTADLEDLENVYVEIDGDDFDGEFDGDYLVFDLGNGFELVDGDSEDFEIRGDIVSGATDTLMLEFDELYDIYVEDEEGYGVPVNLTQDGDFIQIGEGDARLSDSNEEQADEVSVGDDIVIGYFDFDIEGEDLNIDELVLEITVGAGSLEDEGISVAALNADELEDFLLENVEIQDADGNTILSPEDADWAAGEPTVVNNGTVAGVMEVEFENFTFEEGDWEDLMIVVSIDENVNTGTTYQVESIEAADFTDVEGADSDEQVTIAASASFDVRDVEGGALDVELEANTPSEDTTSNDVSDFHMATIEFDATKSGEDVELDSFELELTYAPAGPSTAADIEELTNCRLFDEDNGDEIALNDEVDGEESETTYDFDLEDTLIIPADEKMKLEVRCDLGDDLSNGDTFLWELLVTSDVNAQGADTNNDDFVTVIDSDAATIMIAAATVTMQEDSDSPDDQVVKLGDDVVIGLLEVEADNGEATIEEVTISLSDENVFDDFEVFLYFEGSEEDSIEVTAGGPVTIDGLNIQIDEDDTIELEFRAEATLDVTHVNTPSFLTVDSILLDDGTLVAGPVAFNPVTVYEGVPVVTLISDETNSGLDTDNDLEIFEISIEADGEDVTVDDITVNLSLANVDLSDAFFAAYEDTDHTNEAGTDNETDPVVDGTDSIIETADGDYTFVFTSPIVIPDGDTYYFVLEADTTVDDDTRSLRVTLADEAGTGITFSTPAGLGNSDPILEDDIEVLHRN